MDLRKTGPYCCRGKGLPGLLQGGMRVWAFEGIIGELKKEAGYPYILIPTEMFIFGEGGVAGTSTLCGALNGSAAAIFLVTGAVVPKKRAEAFEINAGTFQLVPADGTPRLQTKESKVRNKTIGFQVTPLPCFCYQVV